TRDLRAADRGDRAGPDQTGTAGAVRVGPHEVELEAGLGAEAPRRSLAEVHHDRVADAARCIERERLRCLELDPRGRAVRLESLGLLRDRRVEIGGGLLRRIAHALRERRALPRLDGCLIRWRVARGLR